MKTAIYCRVSGEEQFKEGVSLEDQLSKLREYANKANLNVVTEIQEISEGDEYFRPQLDQLRRLVESREVEHIISLHRDRFGRGPITGIIIKELRDRGATFFALNSPMTDDSPESEMYGGLSDLFSGYEKSQIGIRTHERGRVRKARKGLITNTRNFGFDYEDNHYLINEEENEVLHFIFDKVAEGWSSYSVAKALNDQGIKSPRGMDWTRQAIRKYIFSEVYFPYSVGELSKHVSPEILHTLDENKFYGLLFYNRFKRKYERVPVDNPRIKNGVPVYPKKLIYKKERPKEDWVAIPVPDSGIPREVILKARANLENNVWQTSKSGERFWELYGIAYCSECGRKLQTATRKASGKIYYYYRCPNTDLGRCSNKKNRRAEILEDRAISVLQDLYSDQSKIKQKVLEHFNKQAKKVRNPDQDIKSFSDRIIKLKGQLEKSRDLYLEDLLSKEELRDKTESINQEILICEAQIERLSRTSQSLESIERKKKVLMDLFEFSTKYDLGLIEQDPNATDQDNQGWIESGAQRRNSLYRELGLKMLVNNEDVWVEINEKSFYPNETSTRTTNAESRR